MRVVVCVRQGLDGELGPFDAAAYEAALRLSDAEVILLSMGPEKTKDFLQKLTRLGAKSAVLLSDPAFAGGDTLATAYTLSLAIARLSPDLILCGRQTLIGDTGQTGPMLSAMIGYGLLTNVMALLDVNEKNVTCATRAAERETVALPALLTVERIHSLRLPRLRSKVGEVYVWTAEALQADVRRCGLTGSPTRVMRTVENRSGKRSCKMIAYNQLSEAVAEGLHRHGQVAKNITRSGAKLKNVVIVGEAARPLAETVSDDITVVPLDREDALLSRIGELAPNAVLWGSDPVSKSLAARIAARMGLGLCADCTALESDGETLLMVRPALSGSLIAEIRSLTRPAMATVRTEEAGERDVIVACGYGARNSLHKAKALASELGASLAAGRRLVDEGLLPYELQVGLTGRTVSPAVYIAIGISGAVHHIVGMERAGTVIAINSDPHAPIFDYADFGIVCEF